MLFEILLQKIPSIITKLTPNKMLNVIREFIPNTA